MTIALRRFLWSVGISTFLAILASPLAAPGLALEGRLATHHFSKALCPLCPTTSFSAGLSYDADSQRCVFGGGGCELHYQ